MMVFRRTSEGRGGGGDEGSTSIWTTGCPTTTTGVDGISDDDDEEGEVLARKVAHKEDGRAWNLVVAELTFSVAVCELRCATTSRPCSGCSEPW